jgi:hypothetical protein
LWEITIEEKWQARTPRRFRYRSAHVQTLTGETLFLTALHVTVRQNQKERRTLDEILDSKDLCDSPAPVTDVRVLGI